MAIIAIDQVARRVAVIDVVRQRGSVAAILIIAVVIRLRHHAAYCLAAELVRALVGVRHRDARSDKVCVQARQQAGRRAVGVLKRRCPAVSTAHRTPLIYLVAVTYFLVGSMIESSFITIRSPYWIIQALFDKSCGIYQFHLSGRTCSNPRNQNLYQTDT